MSERFGIVWTDTARNDLLAIIDYLVHRDGVDAAEAVYNKIVDTVRGLETMPQRCRIVPELEAEGITAYRQLLVGPYRVMFAIRAAIVVVLTTLDGRRDLAELLVERVLRHDG